MNEEYVKVKNVSKYIKRTQVLNDITFSLMPAQIMGLVGPNGSGKTMLLRAIAGLIKTSGEIKIGGDVVGKGKFAKDIGILIENPAFLNDFTGKENLELMAMLQEGIYDTDIQEALYSVGLDPEDRRPFKKYSLGMKERLGIAQAILKKPKLILLDEPTNGIDPKGVESLKRLLLSLKESGSTIIIASHDASFLENVSDIIYEVNRGTLTCLI